MMGLEAVHGTVTTGHDRRRKPDVADWPRVLNVGPIYSGSSAEEAELRQGGGTKRPFICAIDVTPLALTGPGMWGISCITD